MQGRMRNICWLVFTVFAFITPGIQAEDAPVRKYRIAVDSNLKMNLAKTGSAVTVKAIAAFDYTLNPDKDGKIESSIDSIELVTSVNGQGENTTRMSSAGFYNSDGQETRDIPRSQAPANLQLILDQFGLPVARYTLDAEGNEVGKPEMKVKAGVLIDTNAYLLARTFHVRFPKKETRWTIPTSLPLGQGQFSKGDLTFEKQPAVLPDGSVVVKVSGDLTATGKLGAATINKGVYRLKGSQIYNPKVGDWTSGQYNIQMEIDANDPSSGPIKGTGPVTITLKMRQ